MSTGFYANFTVLDFITTACSDKDYKPCSSSVFAFIQPLSGVQALSAPLAYNLPLMRQTKFRMQTKEHWQLRFCTFLFLCIYIPDFETNILNWLVAGFLQN